MPLNPSFNYYGRALFNQQPDGAMFHKDSLSTVYLSETAPAVMRLYQDFDDPGEEEDKYNNNRNPYRELEEQRERMYQALNPNPKKSSPRRKKQHKRRSYRDPINVSSRRKKDMDAEDYDPMSSSERIRSEAASRLTTHSLRGPELKNKYIYRPPLTTPSQWEAYNKAKAINWQQHWKILPPIPPKLRDLEAKAKDKGSKYDSNRLTRLYTKAKKADNKENVSKKEEKSKSRNQNKKGPVRPAAPPRKLTRLEKLAAPKHGPNAIHYETAKDKKDAIKRKKRAEKRQEQKQPKHVVVPETRASRARMAPLDMGKAKRNKESKDGKETFFEIEGSEPKRKKPELPKRRPPAKKKTKKPKITQVEPDKPREPRSRKPALDMSRPKKLKKEPQIKKVIKPRLNAKENKEQNETQLSLQTNHISNVQQRIKSSKREESDHPDNDQEVNRLLVRMKGISSQDDQESPIDASFSEEADGKLRAMFAKMCWWI